MTEPRDPARMGRCHFCRCGDHARCVGIPCDCPCPVPDAPQSSAGETPEHLAQRFHEAYERLAPSFGYSTREASRKPWADVPEQNRKLMIAVCAELLHVMPQSAGETPATDSAGLLHNRIGPSSGRLLSAKPVGQSAGETPAPSGDFGVRLLPLLRGELRLREGDSDLRSLLTAAIARIERYEQSAGETPAPCSFCDGAGKIPGDLMVCPCQRASQSAGETPTEAPIDSTGRGRLMLNDYGRQCWNSGYDYGKRAQSTGETPEALIAEAKTRLERSGLPDGLEYDGSLTIFNGRAHVAYISNHQSGESGVSVAKFYAAAPRLLRGLLDALATSEQENARLLAEIKELRRSR